MEETQKIKSTPLPVANIFGQAIKFPFRQNKKFWIWVLSLCLISFAISLAENYFIWLMLGDFPVKVRIGVTTVLSGLGDVLVFTLLAITCQRMILLDEFHEEWIGFFKWGYRETRFFIWSFLIYLGAMFVLLLPLVMGSSSFLKVGLYPVMNYLLSIDYFFMEWLIPSAWIREMWIFAFTMGIPLIQYFLFLFMLSRVSLVLPATAIDKRPTLSSAWGLSKGNGWRLTFLTTIPIIVYVLGGLSLNRVDFMPPPLFWIPEIIGSVLYVFWGMLEAALLSKAYKELRLQHQVPNFKMLD